MSNRETAVFDFSLPIQITASQFSQYILSGERESNKKKKVVGGWGVQLNSSNVNIWSVGSKEDNTRGAPQSHDGPRSQHERTRRTPQLETMHPITTFAPDKEAVQAAPQKLAQI